jgi:Fibrobacter succinogenes major domain (Fib_succ_major).
MYCFGKYSFGAIFVLLFVFGFGLAGCGDSDSGPTGTPSSVISSSGMSEDEIMNDSSSSSKESTSDSSSVDKLGKQASSSSKEKKIESSSSSSESAPAGNDSKALFGDDYFTKDGVDFVKIGNQSWMEKNVKITSGIDKGFLRCYDDNDKMCDKYGTMTQWEAFTDTWSWFRGYDGPLLLSDPVKGACPNGTHLPTKAELEELVAYLDEHSDEMEKLTNQLGGVYGEGFPDDEKYYDDEDGDITLLGFHGAEDSFVLLGGELSEAPPDPSSETLGAWSLHYGKSTGLTLIKMDTGRSAYARCLMDDSTETASSPDTLTFAPGCDEVHRENWDYLNPDVEYGCIKDERDGRFYKTLIIEGKLWFAENLRFVPSEASWCYTTLDDGECDLYGRYYSGAAVRDLSGICPEGFHVASETEMKSLSKDSAVELLSAEGWKQNDNTVMSGNSTGFTILPGGVRGGDEPNNGWTLGEFSGIEGIAYFWTRGQNGISQHYYVAIRNVAGDKFSSSLKYNDFAMPVRCVKN